MFFVFHTKLFLILIAIKKIYIKTDLYFIKQFNIAFGNKVKLLLA